MPEVAQAVEPSAPEPVKPMEYDAFLSYAHRDKQVTTAIQKGLHRIGRRVGHLRALRVFRDDTNLEATPNLWGRITDALDRSRYMIVVLTSSGGIALGQRGGQLLASTSRARTFAFGAGRRTLALERKGSPVQPRTF